MRGILLILPLLLFSCGCEALPYPRELESTMLVRVLGVDQTQEEVRLTAADMGEGSVVLMAEGRSFEEACQNLKQAGEEYVALTHVTQILVGEESDLQAVLEAALAQKEVGQSATVWWAEGGAGELMKSVGGGARRLTSIELNTERLNTATVLEALAELEEGGAVPLPKIGRRNGVLEVVD